MQLDAWSRLRSLKLADWEVATILKMDATYLQLLAKKRAAADGNIDPAQETSSRPLTAELFDAIFPS